MIAALMSQRLRGTGRARKRLAYFTTGHELSTSCQAVEKGSSASLPSIASLRLAYSLWLIAYGSLISSICHKRSALCDFVRAPRI